jgi:hypothetical protein
MSNSPKTIWARPNPKIPYPHALGVTYQPNKLTITPKAAITQLVVICLASLFTGMDNYCYPLQNKEV